MHSTQELRARLNEIEDELSVIRDPWIRASLGRERKEIKNELIARGEF